MSYVFPWVILLTGTLMILIFTPKALNRIAVKKQDTLNYFRPQEKVGKDDDVLEYLQSLEAEITFLREDLVRLGRQAEKDESFLGKTKTQEPGEASFQEVLERRQKAGSEIELYKAVFQAYDNGKSVTEIAREQGRGKGEIELILGLRR